jgi:hypothetical protein
VVEIGYDGGRREGRYRDGGQNDEERKVGMRGREECH